MRSLALKVFERSRTIKLTKAYWVMQQFQVGDPVIYTKQKVSASPGRRAHDVAPASKGDTYSYIVDKYWVVVEVLGDGAIKLRTRRGKEHILPQDDPMLRRAKWWEKLFYASRFKPAPSE